MSHNFFQKTVLPEVPLCYFTPLLKTTTGTQNPSEPAAVVSFRDDDIKWGRIEVSWWGEFSAVI